MLDAMDSEAMRAEGFSDIEIAKAEALFQDIDAYLSEMVDLDWHDVEALV